MSGCQRVFTRLKVQTTQFWCNLETHEWNQTVNLEVAVNDSVISQNHSESHLAFPKYGYFLWCCKLVAHSRYPVNCYSAAVVCLSGTHGQMPPVGKWSCELFAGQTGRWDGAELGPLVLSKECAVPPRTRMFWEQKNPVQYFPHTRECGWIIRSFGE